MDPATSSCPGATAFSVASQLPPTDSVKMIDTSIISPNDHLVPLDHHDLSFINDVCMERVAAESSHCMQTRSQPPFMSMRAGSAPVPKLLSDFNKGLGSHVYVPRTVIRLRDDGRDPTQARDLIDAMTPPLLTVDANHRSLEELIARHDAHSFQAVVSGALLRNRTETMLRELSQSVARLEEEKKTITDECLSVKSNLEVLSKEKENMVLRMSGLSDEMKLKDITLGEKEREFLESKSSIQKEIDELKAELSREKQLRADLAGRADRGEAFLDAFPDLFRRLLDHPDFRGTFDAFNNATLDVGELRGCVNIRKFMKENPSSKIPIFKSDAPNRLKVADEAWKAKEFPIVDEIPFLARTLGVSAALDRISSASVSAPASTSVSASTSAAVPPSS